MSLGGGVSITLLLLAPGLAFYVALFGRQRADPCQVELASPNSTLAISLIALGAIGAHTFGAAICELNRLWVAASLPAAPEISGYTLYDLLVCLAPQSGGADNAVCSASGGEASGAGLLFAIGGWTLGLSAVTYGGAHLFAASELGWRALSRMRFGWAAELMRDARREGGFASAFVVSSMEADGVFLAYEGVLETLSLDSKQEVASVSLQFVDRFLVRLTPRGLTRTEVQRDLIPRLYIERSQIKNIAFKIYDVGGDVD